MVIADVRKVTYLWWNRLARLIKINAKNARMSAFSAKETLQNVFPVVS